jgi:hypothetical protein
MTPEQKQDLYTLNAQWHRDVDLRFQQIYKWVEARLSEAQVELTATKEKLKSEYRVSIGEVWHWQGDEYDHPESLTCPILIKPEQLRELVATHQKDLEESRIAKEFPKAAKRVVDAAQSTIAMRDAGYSIDLEVLRKALAVYRNLEGEAAAVKEGA